MVPERAIHDVEMSGKNKVLQKPAWPKVSAGMQK